MTTTHKFRDGITRPAHQHNNGGGWVAENAYAADEAYIGPRAEVIGGTIRGGTIRGGTIWGGTIEGGTIWGGTIEGGTILDGTILGGTIWGGTIWGGTIRGGTIWGGTIWGGDVTRDVTFICGCIPYQVTITDTHAGVGCQWKTHDEWETDGAKIATDNNMTTADYELLMMFIRRHQQGAKT